MQVDLTKATQHTEYSFAVHSIIALQHNGRSFQHRILHQFYQIHSIPNLSLGARMPTNTTNTLSASFLTHFIGLLFIATATPRLFLHKAHDSNNKYDSKNCHCRDQDHPQYDVLITWNMIWDIFYWYERSYDVYVHLFNLSGFFADYDTAIWWYRYRYLIM